MEGHGWVLCFCYQIGTLLKQKPLSMMKPTRRSVKNWPLHPQWRCFSSATFSVRLDPCQNLVLIVNFSRATHTWSLVQIIVE